MGRARLVIAALLVLVGSLPDAARAQRLRGAGTADGRRMPQADEVVGSVRLPPQERRATDSDGMEFPITVRAGTLAAQIETIGGLSVRVPSARVVGVFDPRVFLIESQTPLRPVIGHRDRVLVFIDRGMLGVAPATLVASSVTVLGVARTLLGMQVSREVPWPPTVTRDVLERLEIHAAVLARSVRTADGVDLLARPSASTTIASTPFRR